MTRINYDIAGTLFILPTALNFQSTMHCPVAKKYFQYIQLQHAKFAHNLITFKVALKYNTAYRVNPPV